MKVRGRSDTSEIWELYSTFHGDLAFDIGANGGAVANLLAPHFETVLAFEPATESYYDLIADAPFNVKPYQLAVSNVCGPIFLEEADYATGKMGELVTDTDTSPLSRGWGAKTGQRTVIATTLDAICRIHGAPDFIKIDVEGHEARVIEGGLEALKKHDPILLIEIHSAALGGRIEKLLPDYQWIRYDHEIYTAQKSPLVNEHFWVRGEKT